MGITDKGMRALAQDADQWLIETFERGAGSFVGRITVKGERLFYFRYVDPAGARPRLPLGAYDARGKAGLTVEQARSKARGLSTLYRSGVRDLRAHLANEAQAAQLRTEVDRIKAEAERLALEDLAEKAKLERERKISVRTLFKRWASVELTPHLRADGTRTGRKDAGEAVRLQFEHWVFASLGDQAAEAVNKAALMAIIDEAKAKGKLRTANVLLANLKQMFRFAAARDIVLRNPLESVTKKDAGGKEVERDRVLSAEEIKALAGARRTANLNTRSWTAIWIILGTCCRVGELMAAEWRHIDLLARTWYLPQTKNERVHTIHLSAFVVGHLERLGSHREIGADGSPIPWLLPNTTGTGPVDIRTFGKQLSDRQRAADRRLERRSKQVSALALPGGRWTAHDLRRTGATLMASLGVSSDVIDECLNHKIESRVRRTYIHDRRPTEQAKAFDALGAKLTELVGDTVSEDAAPDVRSTPSRRRPTQGT